MLYVLDSFTNVGNVVLFVCCCYAQSTGWFTAIIAEYFAKLLFVGFAFRKNKSFFSVDRLDDFVSLGVVRKVLRDALGARVNMTKVAMVFYRIGTHPAENGVLSFGGGHYYTEIIIKQAFNFLIGI